MKSFAAIIFLVSPAFIALAGQGPATKAEYPPIVTAKNLYAKNDLRGKKAPELVVQQWLSGKAPDTKGKVLVVDYWATWCEPCREFIPEMNAWAKKFEKDAVFVGLSNESAKIVNEFQKTTPMNYHIAIDRKRRMVNALGVQGIPHVMIVSPDGIVRWQGWPGSPEDRLTDKIIEQIIAASKSSE